MLRYINHALNTAAPRLSQRVVPSAGALYPIEMYLVALNIEGLEVGLYHYHPKDRLLDLLRAEELRSDIESTVLYPEIATRVVVVDTLLS